MNGEDSPPGWVRSRQWLWTRVLLPGIFLAAAVSGVRTWAAESPGFIVSATAREIVLFVGVTSFEPGQTRSVTVYGDGSAVLHVDSENEVLEKIFLRIDRAELEAILKGAVSAGLTEWDSEALGRRAEALGFQLVGEESKTRTRVLFAFDSLSHGGVTEKAVSRTLALHDSRALAAAFPELGEYSAVVRLEDWMENLWQRPLSESAAPHPEPVLVVPSGSKDVILRISSRQTEATFFGDGAVLLGIWQPVGETLDRRSGRLAASELAELQAVLRRLVYFDARAVAVQVFRKTGKSIPNRTSDSGPQSFEVHLWSPSGGSVEHRFEYAAGAIARRFPSIQELADLKRVWELAFASFGIRGEIPTAGRGKSR